MKHSMSTGVSGLAVAALLAAPAHAMTQSKTPGAALTTMTKEMPAEAMAKTGTKYKADVDMQAVLDTLASLNGKPIETLGPSEARKQPTPIDAVNAILNKQGKDTAPTALVPGVTSEDRQIPGAVGPLPARIYTPSGPGPFPVIVYFHGGGWVIADRTVYDGGARGLSKQANAIVVSPDYRLAPEAKFPAAWDDALAVYRWVAANATTIKGDPKRLALAGESAGGNLAVSTAVSARDAGVTAPLHIVAVYPVAQTANLSTESYVDSAAAKPLNKAMIQWFVDKVFAKQDDAKSPRVDLVNANLKGLPPVTIINAQIDPLRSDGELLEDALKKAGVKTERRNFDGTAHDFFGAAAVVKDAQEAQAYAGKRLKQAFGNVR